MSPLSTLDLSSTSTYRRLLSSLSSFSAQTQRELRRELCRTDLYWLLWHELGRADLEHEWLLARCKEVQAAPDDCLDLWAREHYKSTIITFGLTIQNVLVDPEATTGIFSHTRPIAKGFLRQIKREFESNEKLKLLFPEILWTDPGKDSPKWSEDDGLIVKRTGNPKESTIEAHGLVDGQPTSKHFGRLVYDDVVTLASVSSPEMIRKTTEALELSYNLGAEGGARRMIGTRYHLHDTYATLMKRGTFRPRLYPATDDGTATGNPVLISRERLVEKRRDMGPYTFGCQLLLNPIADSTQGFKRDWVKHFKNRDGTGMNKYIIVDPAGAKKTSSDRTAMVVVGLAADSNYYLLDAIYDRLNLSERVEKLFMLHRRWKPINVGYEKYGKDSDIEHIQYVQDQKNYRFNVVPLGGQLKKEDRIRRLVPLFENGRFYIPDHLHVADYEGRTVDVVEQFLVEEYDPFPVAMHDDFLDALSRICDVDLLITWPQLEEIDARYKRTRSSGSSWAA